MHSRYVALHKASQKGVAVLILFSPFITVRFYSFFCAIQPLNFFLSTAGCCFSKTEERNTAALMLESIEEDLGWAAKYRANDLYRQWGWRRSFSNA